MSYSTRWTRLVKKNLLYYKKENSATGGKLFPPNDKEILALKKILNFLWESCLFCNIRVSKCIFKRSRCTNPEVTIGRFINKYPNPRWKLCFIVGSPLYLQMIDCVSCKNNASNSENSYFVATVHQTKRSWAIMSLVKDSTEELTFSNDNLKW